MVIIAEFNGIRKVPIFIKFRHRRRRHPLMLLAGDLMKSTSILIVNLLINRKFNTGTGKFEVPAKNMRDDDE